MFSFSPSFSSTGFCLASYSAMLFNMAVWCQPHGHRLTHGLLSLEFNNRERKTIPLSMSRFQILHGYSGCIYLEHWWGGMRAGSGNSQSQLELNHRLLLSKGGLRPTEKCAAQMKTTCPLEYKAGNLPINYKWLINMEKIQICYKIKE